MSIFTFFKKPKETVIDVQFGAYYSIKSKDGYEVIRLLDYPGDSYHYQLMGSTLPEPPSLADVANVKPFIQHVPMEIAALIGKDITYIGHRPLSNEDLAGYRVYLEEMGADDEAIATHFKQLIDLSTRTPERMRLYQDRDGVFGESI